MGASWRPIFAACALAFWSLSRGNDTLAAAPPRPRISIVNASGRADAPDGLAARLKQDKIVVTKIVPSSKPNPTCGVYYAPAFEEMAQKIRQVLSVEHEFKPIDWPSAFEIVIVLGQNYAAPAPAAPADAGEEKMPSAESAPAPFPDAQAAPAPLPQPTATPESVDWQARWSALEQANAEQKQLLESLKAQIEEMKATASKSGATDGTQSESQSRRFHVSALMGIADSGERISSVFGPLVGGQGLMRYEWGNPWGIEASFGAFSKSASVVRAEADTATSSLLLVPISMLVTARIRSTSSVEPILGIGPSIGILKLDETGVLGDTLSGAASAVAVGYEAFAGTLLHFSRSLGARVQLGYSYETALLADFNVNAGGPRLALGLEY